MLSNVKTVPTPNFFKMQKHLYPILPFYDFIKNVLLCIFLITTQPPCKNFVKVPAKNISAYYLVYWSLFFVFDCLLIGKKEGH